MAPETEVTMVSEKEAETRANYRRTAEAIGRFLGALGNNKPSLKQPAAPPAVPLSPETSIRGARLLIQDVCAAEKFKDWLPRGLSDLAEWAEVQDASLVLKRSESEHVLYHAVYHAVDDRESDLWARCADLVWVSNPQRPSQDRIDFLEDLRRLHLLAAGETI